MRLRVLILACAATAGGCGFLYVRLATKLRGFRTNVAKIRKEEIADALGVEVSGRQQRR